MKDLYLFKEINKNDVEKAGVKGAYLGELYNNGFSVPVGFIISPDAFENFLKDNNIKDKIKNLLSVISTDDKDKLQKIVNEIQKLIVTTKIGEGLKTKIIEAYQSLDVKEGEDVNKLLDSKDVLVAVRSSSVLEGDGLHATFLNINGVERLIKMIQACWASLFTARAVSHREDKEINHLENGIAVIVQKMIDIRKSGFIFTTNPKNNNEVVVKSYFGVIDSLTSIEMNSDKHVFKKDTFEMVEEEIKRQEFRYILDEETGKTEKEDLGDVGSNEVLEIKDIKELVRQGKKIESLFGEPMEVQWGYEDKFYFMQLKPTHNVGVEVEQEVEVETYETEPQEEQQPYEGQPVQEQPADDAIEIEVVEEKITGPDISAYEEYEIKEESEEAPKEEYEEELKQEEEPEHIEEPDVILTEVEEDIKTYDEEIPEEQDPIENKKDLFDKIIFAAGSTIIACDTAISLALRKKYFERFGKTAPNNLHQALEELKESIEIPLEDAIKRVHELRNRYLKEQKAASEDIKFALDTVKKFLEEF